MGIKNFNRCFNLGIKDITEFLRGKKIKHIHPDFGRVYVTKTLDKVNIFVLLHIHNRCWQAKSN